MRSEYAALICLAALLMVSERGAGAPERLSADPNDLSKPERPPEIGLQNVGALRLAVTFRTGSPHAPIATPQAAGGRLLLLTPFPHALIALDLDGSDLHEAWTYRPPTDPSAEGRACCGLGVRGPEVSGDHLYLNTLDGRTIALEADTGRVAWEARAADAGRGETLASAPLAATNRIFVGNAAVQRELR